MNTGVYTDLPQEQTLNAPDAVSAEGLKHFSRDQARMLAKRYMRLVQRPAEVGSPFAAQSFWQSVGFAWEGLRFAYQTQRNFRIDVTLMAGTMLLGLLSTFTAAQWLCWTMMMGLLLGAEIANTVVEWLVDLYTSGQYDLRAKYIKDMAAGACLLIAGSTAVVLLLLFVPTLMQAAHGWMQLLGH
jgi:diacylglycerol kinase